MTSKVKEADEDGFEEQVDEHNLQRRVHHADFDISLAPRQDWLKCMDDFATAVDDIEQVSGRVRGLRRKVGY